MPGENLGQYPRSQISIGAAVSFQCTDFTYKKTNGGKLKSTLRKDPGGFVRGARAVSGSLNIIVDEDGDEYDWDTAVDFMIPEAITVKKPGGVIQQLVVVFTEVGTDGTLEDGTKRPVSFVGYTVSL